LPIADLGFAFSYSSLPILERLEIGYRKTKGQIGNRQLEIGNQWVIVALDNASLTQ
jgi:hypothetical protein